MAAITPFPITQEHLRSEEDPQGIHFGRDGEHRLIDPISFEVLTEESTCVKVNCCNHVFLRGSLAEYLNSVHSNALCPTCRHYIGRIEPMLERDEALPEVYNLPRRVYRIPAPIFPLREPIRVGQRREMPEGQRVQPRRENMAIAPIRDHVIQRNPMGLTQRQRIAHGTLNNLIFYGKKLKYIVPYTAATLASSALLSWGINNSAQKISEAAFNNILLAGIGSTLFLASRFTGELTAHGTNTMKSIFIGLSSSLLGIAANKIYPLAGEILSGIIIGTASDFDTAKNGLVINIYENLVRTSSIKNGITALASSVLGFAASYGSFLAAAKVTNHLQDIPPIITVGLGLSSYSISLLTAFGLTHYKNTIFKTALTAATAFTTYALKKIRVHID